MGNNYSTSSRLKLAFNRDKIKRRKCWNVSRVKKEFTNRKTKTFETELAALFAESEITKGDLFKSEVRKLHNSKNRKYGKNQSI